MLDTTVQIHDLINEHVLIRSDYGVWTLMRPIDATLYLEYQAIDAIELSLDVEWEA
jgi:hypothetical protein